MTLRNVFWLTDLNIPILTAYSLHNNMLKIRKTVLYGRQDDVMDGCNPVDSELVRSGLNSPLCVFWTLSSCFRSSFVCVWETHSNVGVFVQEVCWGGCWGQYCHRCPRQRTECPASGLPYWWAGRPRQAFILAWAVRSGIGKWGALFSHPGLTYSGLHAWPWIVFAFGLFSFCYSILFALFLSVLDAVFQTY